MILKTIFYWNKIFINISVSKIITHGRTLCTKILFSEAIHAINETAFKTSPYPVLLSFENFCSRRMQEKMVKYLLEILGDHLLTEPLSNFPVNKKF